MGKIVPQANRHTEEGWSLPYLHVLRYGGKKRSKQIRMAIKRTTTKIVLNLSLAAAKKSELPKKNQNPLKN